MNRSEFWYAFRTVASQKNRFFHFTNALHRGLRIDKSTSKYLNPVESKAVRVAGWLS